MKTEQADLIVGIASRGDGVTGDGRYVAFAAPGDRLAEDGGLIEGPHHRPDACVHFRQCGGCQLQHVDDEAYSVFVLDRITGALKSQGVTADRIEPVHLSPPASRRRIALRAGGDGKKMKLGFSASGSHRIIDIRQCPVTDPRLFQLLDPLRRFAAQWRQGKSQWQLKLALVDQGPDLLIEGYEPEGFEAIEALSDFARENGLARVSTDSGYGPELRWQEAEPTVTFGGVAVAFPPYGFLQATQDGQGVLLNAVERALDDAKTVADLFAGLGTFALPLSDSRKIYAAEGERQAVLALQNAANGAQRSITVEHRDLFRRPLGAAEASRFDAVILDPPRAGAKEQIRELASSTVRTVAYVSCNPATFARDARTLAEGGYRLARLWPVGQFRWSTHVELVGQFVRPGTNAPRT